MKRNTYISSELNHTTKFINPRTGEVLKEGKTPTQTIRDFKENPQGSTGPSSISISPERAEKIETEMSEIKGLLKELINKK